LKSKDRAYYEKVVVEVVLKKILHTPIASHLLATACHPSWHA